MQICANCGEENPDRFRLCGFCGTSLAPETPVEEVRRTVSIVFSDLNTSAQVDPGDTVLRVQSAFTGRIPDTFNASNNVTAITYNREGFPRTAVGFLTTTITLKDSTANGTWTRCLVIAAATPLSTQTHTMSPLTCL